MEVNTQQSTTFKKIGKLRGHTETVWCLEIKEEKKILCSGSEDKTCRFWDLNTNKATKCLLHEEGVNSVCFHPKKDYLVFTASGKSISAKGSFLASCDDSGEIKIFNLDQDSLFKTLRCHKNICTSVKFRPRHPWEVVSGALDCKIYNCEFSRGKPKFSFDLASSGQKQIVNPPFVYCLDISQDDRKLVAGLGDCTIAIFDLNAKRKTHILESHTASVSQVIFPAFEPINHVLSGANDKMIALWNISEQNANELSNKKSFQDVIIIIAPEAKLDHEAKINWLCSSQTSNSIFIADQSNDISVISI